VRAEREHGNLWVQLPRHLLDAREPVVEIRPPEPRGEPALDADDVDRPGDALERLAGNLGERVAADPHAERVRRREERLRRTWPLRPSPGAWHRPRRPRLTWLLRTRPGAWHLPGAPRERAGRRRQREVHPRVDPILVAPADRHLELVPRRRQVQRTAEGDERPRHVDRDLALKACWLDLRLLPQTLRLQDG